jgi:transketolase
VYASADQLQRGAYVLNPALEKPDVILLASGSEVELIAGAEAPLLKAGVRARLVSVPCWRLFEQQSAEYRASVLPSAVRARLAVEAGSPLGWERFTGLEGATLTIDRFGASAPGATLFKEYGFTVEHVVERALALTARR